STQIVIVIRTVVTKGIADDSEHRFFAKILNPFWGYAKDFRDLFENLIFHIFTLFDLRYSLLTDLQLVRKGFLLKAAQFTYAADLVTDMIWLCCCAHGYK